MKNSKSMIATIVLASASVASSMAFAQDVSSPAEPLNLVGTSGFFGDAFEPGNPGASFMDQFTFTVTDIAHDIDAIVSSISPTADVGLDITEVGLFTAAGDQLTTGTLGSSGAQDIWTLSADSLAVGDYYLQVSGTMQSGSSGAFGGSAMLNPVPEPATYGMMLAGLGVLGFLARRRKLGQEN